jgi:hypothetical protein
MGFGSWLSKMIGNTGGEIVSSVGETVDRFVTTDEDRMKAEQLKQELQLKVMKLEFEAEKAYLKDRQSAREMYKHDSSLQKLYAMTFLVAYFALTGILLHWLITELAGTQALDLPQWGVALISSIWGGMSTKVSTITDFLFGGSQGERENQDQVRQAFEKQERDRGDSE